MATYDYLIVGAGLYGAVFAQKAMECGKSVLVIDKRMHVAGNVYTERIEGINVHRYGAHIFHTNDRQVWDYVNRFAEFNRFTNSPIANFRGEIYSLPFNMYTFNKMWGVKTPEEAAAKITEQRGEIQGPPKNLEEQAISLVGRDIFEKLVKGYTEKQWGRDCRELPAFIIKRLPVRLTFDNNYFNALYQGIPIGGYTKMVENMLEGAKVRLGIDYLKNRAELEAQAEKVIYTGPIDAYFEHCLGYLEYRSVRFETEILLSQLKFLYPLKTLVFPAFSPSRFGPFPSFFPLREEMRETFFRLSLQPYPAALRKFAWPLWWRERKCSLWYLHQNVPAAPAHPWVRLREREGWSYMYALTV